jgi:hypothetical protein
MNINNAEFLLLSRTGRGLHSTRAGPQPFELPKYRPEREGRALPPTGRTGLSLRRRLGRGRGLRHVLGARGGGPARTARTLGYGDPEYFEMEFAVGFPAEEETLL